MQNQEEAFHDFLEYIIHFDKKSFLQNARGILRISQGYESLFPHFNVWALTELLPQIAEATYNNFLPYIDLKGRRESDFQWDKYFLQPFDDLISTKELLQANELIDLDSYIEALWLPRYTASKGDLEIAASKALYRNFVMLNPGTKSYIDSEIHSVLSKAESKEGGQTRILGLVARGTDMLALKPSNHPIQPSLDELYLTTLSAMKQGDFDAIYLATEDQKIYDFFNQRFPGLILTNKRHYLDKSYQNYYQQNPDTYLAPVLEENAASGIDTDLEYLSSLYILSACQGLIGGNCGATNAALFLNDSNYDYVDIANLGFYP